MIITVMKKGRGVRVAFGAEMYGQAFLSPEDRYDFATGICVAMVKAEPTDKFMKDHEKDFLHCTYWNEFDLADAYVGLVMKHQRAYNREIAARTEKAKDRTLQVAGDQGNVYYNLYVSSVVDYVSEGAIALAHALRLKKDLDEEVRWQKLSEKEEFIAKEWEDLPWPLETLVP